MKLTTTRFGEIEVDVSELVYFRYGLLGFESCHRYALIRPDEENPFVYMQSVDEPNLTFVVTQPFWFRPDYRVQVSPDELEDLGTEQLDDIAVYTIVTASSDPKKMTVNLKAPLLIHGVSRNAKQIVLVDGPYAIRHKLVEEIERVQQRTKAEEGAQQHAETKSISLRTVG